MAAQFTEGKGTGYDPRLSTQLTKRIVYGIAGGLFILCVSVIVFRENGNPNYNPDEDEVKVWIAAQEIVKSRLKSPGTAEWGGLFAGDYQDPREAVTKVEENLYEVRGWVDSQNSFGAKVRINFSLRLRGNPDRGWELAEEPHMVQR